MLRGAVCRLGSRHPDEAGQEDYKRLELLTRSGYQLYCDTDSGFAWLFNGSTFWSYDNPQVIRQKMAYVKSTGLGGAMAWSLDGDNAHGSLLDAMHSGLA